MIVEFKRKVSQVDFGIAGKRNLDVDVRLQYNDNKWQLYCWYIYTINEKGHKEPVSPQLIDPTFLTQIVNDCLKDVQAIGQWTFQK